MNKRILFLTVGDRTWASSRLRSYWPADIIPGAHALQWRQGTEIPDDYDAYVWMKTGDVDVMRTLRQMGKLQFIEVCDPAWWWQPREQRALIDECTAIVAASEPTAKDILSWYGDKKCYVIPDRLNLAHYTTRRTEYALSAPLRFIWYGVAANRFVVSGAIPFLERLEAEGVKLSLTICDNYPDKQWTFTDRFPVYFTQWSLDRESEIIAAHDIAFLPKYPPPWGPLKTNNRALTAWACGLPVTDAENWLQLYTLATSATERRAQAEFGYELLVNHYTTEKTAQDWISIVEELSA